MSEPEGLLVGRNPVREALERQDGRLEKVLIQKGAHGSQIDAIRRAAREAGIRTQVVPSQKMQRLAPRDNHQGVIAFSAPIAYADVTEMLEGIAGSLDAVKAIKPVVLMLDGIEDPHNFGAILRTAVAAGVGGVIVPDRGQAPLSSTTLKASAGTAMHLPIARVSNLADHLHSLKERGYWVVGLDSGEGQDGLDRTTVWDYDWDRPIVLVIGSEGQGMRPRVRSSCDVLASIPMRGEVESLNASVAAGIALFAAVRGRD